MRELPKNPWNWSGRVEMFLEIFCPQDPDPSKLAIFWGPDPCRFKAFHWRVKWSLGVRSTSPYWTRIFGWKYITKKHRWLFIDIMRIIYTCVCMQNNTYADAYNTYIYIYTCVYLYKYFSQLSIQKPCKLMFSTNLKRLGSQPSTVSRCSFAISFNNCKQ